MLHNNMKNSFRSSSDAGQTSVGHIANENTISVIDDLVTSKKRYFLLNFAVRQPSDLHQLISLHLFFIFCLNHMKNKSFDLLQPCCEVCERNYRSNSKIKIVTELHPYHFLKISLSGFQRKQPIFLPNYLGK